MAVTVTQLAAFLSVVRHGSVTAAAEELVVTQPSVSAAVAALERELGVKLTERVAVERICGPTRCSTYEATLASIRDERVFGERGPGCQRGEAGTCGSRPSRPSASICCRH